MKRKLGLLVFWGLLLSIVVTPIMTVYADEMIDHTERKTGVGIGFDQIKEIPEEIPPIKYQPSGPKNVGQLPHTGELLTSFIILMVGLSILIVFVGLANLKRVYYIGGLE